MLLLCLVLAGREEFGFVREHHGQFAVDNAGDGLDRSAVPPQNMRAEGCGVPSCWAPVTRVMKSKSAIPGSSLGMCRCKAGAAGAVMKTPQG